MERAYALSRRTESMLSAPDVAPGCIKAAQSESIILRDRIDAVRQATRVASRKRKKNDSSRSSKSPRTVYTYEAADSSTLQRSACSSPRTSFNINAGAIMSPEMIQSDGPDGPPDGIPTTEPFGESSMLSRPSSHSKLGAINTFDDLVKESVLGLSEEFADSSTLLHGLRGSKIAPVKTTLLILEAVTSRATSVRSAKSIINHAKRLIHFYLDTRNVSDVTLTGEGSLVLLRDYIGSLKDRGATAPSAARHALTVWPDALGIDCPLTNTLAISASDVESDEGPRQAPSMDLETIRNLEDSAANVEILISKRAFAAGILLMTYDSLRFADVQRLRSLEANADSIRGTLLTSKVKKQHGHH